MRPIAATAASSSSFLRPVMKTYAPSAARRRQRAGGRAPRARSGYAGHPRDAAARAGARQHPKRRVRRRAVPPASRPEVLGGVSLGVLSRLGAEGGPQERRERGDKGSGGGK